MTASLRVLHYLSEKYPNVQSAASELINLSAILNLPKGTEYFIADIHGEYDAFNHLLKNASGIILEKIKERFAHYDEATQNRLAFFIYYPTDMMAKYQKKLSYEDHQRLLRDILVDMIVLGRQIVIKYTQSKVRKAMPEEFAYVMQELLYESRSHEDKKEYYEAILNAVFETRRANKLVVEMSRLIRRLAVDRLHIVGDIYDRGPSPHWVVEQLMKRKNVDVQWGNHDILWMGAASGSLVCIANVIRIAARYDNLDCLEDGYGINLRKFAAFAQRQYQNDACLAFYPKTKDSAPTADAALVAKMHKAISIIQFKLERDVFKNHPAFKLEDRCALHRIDPATNTYVYEGKAYPLKDTYFPTVDFAGDPYALTDDEWEVMHHLKQLFLHNELLQKHVKYLFEVGSMVLKTNQTLLFHAAVPCEPDGSLATFDIDGQVLQGPSLFAWFEQTLRQAYFKRYDADNPTLDVFVYAWCGPKSPLFAKDVMRTFERTFVDDQSLHKEAMNPYFTLRTQDGMIDRILEAFGLDPHRGKIINGHVPIDITQEAQDVSSSQRLYLIDGGMSKQYADKTSMGGYTLMADSYAFFLVSHERFESYQTLIETEQDIVSVTHSENLAHKRQHIYDTDNGILIQETIEDLNALIEAFRSGLLKEKRQINPQM